MIKANKSEDDGLAVSFFVQFKSYGWQKQTVYRLKPKFSRKTSKISTIMRAKDPDLITGCEIINNITFNSNLAESGSITGLNEREWGQIGVNSMQGTFGCTCI